MKVNYKRLVIWIVVLVLWAGAWKVGTYAVSQQFAAVATDQVDPYTDSYKVLRTQNTLETVINVVGVSGAIFFLVMAGKAFKINKEE